LFASVQTYISSENINFGDSVTLKIEATGSDIEFGDIYEICKSNIENSSTSQSISIINGNTTKKLSKTFLFTPNKDCTIEPQEVKIDGKIEKTKPINIKVNTNIQQTQNENFKLEISSNKKNAYLYEPIDITIKLKRKENKEVLDIKLGDINFESFWVKQTKKEKSYREKGFIVHELYYTIYPQKSGKIDINPTSVNIALRKTGYDPFGFIATSAKWQRIYSNKIELNIKDIPNGINIVGDFDIKTSVDKTSTNANEAVNLNINISGHGNIDDINEFKLNIQDTNIYTDKAIKKNNSFKQTMAIVSEDSYEIPAIEFKYFSLKDKKVKIKKTKPIKIRVMQNSKNIPIVQKQIQQRTNQTITQQSISKDDKILFFIMGVISTIIIIAIIYIIIKYRKNAIDSIEEMFPTDKEKLKLLLPYFGRNKEIDKTVNDIEENIYHNKNYEIEISKDIKEFIK
jgi:hypothetical protein